MHVLTRVPAAMSLLTALLFTLPGCDEDGGPGPALTGVLRDAAGQPLSGAGILLEYDLVYGPRARALPGMIVGFSLPVAGPVRVWVSAPGARRPLRVIWDGELPAGQHDFLWDGADGDGVLQVPGVYDAHVLIARGESIFEILWQDVRFEELVALEGREWHAFTRANGTFRISLEGLAFGATFGELSVPWRARVWVVSPGRGAVASADWVTVDPQAGAQIELNYPEEPD